MPYEVFEHTADLGLRVWAGDPNALFAEAAAGLFALIVPDRESIRLSETRLVRLTAEAIDYLFFDWLNELLYLYETQHLLLAEFAVDVSDRGLFAEVRGEPIDHTRHVLDHEVKAITYHGLKVSHTGSLWRAEVIVDI